jgi:thiol-disulfide isomerase/thioredoxin
MRAAPWLALALAFCGPADALEAGGKAPALAALEGTRGKVAYVDFWASWCVPCRLSMPVLDGLYRKHGARGFAVVGINKDVSAADAKRFLDKVPVTFTWVPDAGDAAAKAFDVKAMPSGYLIDRRGVVRYVHRGFTAETAAALERQVEELLKEPS